MTEVVLDQAYHEVHRLGGVSDLLIRRIRPQIDKAWATKRLADLQNVPTDRCHVSSVKREILTKVLA